MHLFLIGYRGTGKTTLGRTVAARLGLPFVDLDEKIAKATRKSIPEIFSKEGEGKFRDYESLELKKACTDGKQVISCGGGIITREENISLMKKEGLVVLLTAPAKVIYSRIYFDKNRPALTEKDPLEEIKFMLEKRKEAYQKAKDAEIDTSTGTVKQRAGEIAKLYREASKI